MPEQSDEATFSFSWLALKLLGRGLYSNPWSALSELVANGFDAGAKNVNVYVDMSNKANAIVEVIDDGSGMGRADIDTYVKVGYNKRQDPRYAEMSETLKPKGRKGIGKLAALFLSRHFYLETRHIEGDTSWELDAREEAVQDEDRPKLLATEDVPSTPNDELWSAATSGTRLILTDVDLTGYGAQSINALGSRLANQFLLPASGIPSIKLWVRSSESELAPNYQAVEKSIAFGNLVDVVQNFPDASTQPAELASDPAELTIPAPGLPKGSTIRLPVRGRFDSTSPEPDALSAIAEFVDPEQREYRGIKYMLTGWIGVHASISPKTAKLNDERFIKNKYYNPAQIRVYVRGKLANDHLLSQLGLTGTYVNYIEGEISFDLLDEDNLADIATSNRQDFDETDGRVTLLRALVRPIVRGLISRRNAIAKEIAAASQIEKERRETAGKRNFTEQLRADLAYYPQIPEATRDELQAVIVNKIQGDVLPKQNYRVFISHASQDRAFASFIDELLRTKGATTDEIFYTSRTGSIERTMDERALGPVIKESITDANTLIFYMTSKNFLDSQFCLFEGGAGWATRGVSEYLKLNMDYSSIPSFLTNGKAEMTILADRKIELSLELNNYVIDGVLNPMIDHLNRGREIAGEQMIERFSKQDLPSAVELAKSGLGPLDYRDPVVLEHWDVLVDPEIASYLAAYAPTV